MSRLDGMPPGMSPEIYRFLKEREDKLAQEQSLRHMQDTAGTFLDRSAKWLDPGAKKPAFPKAPARPNLTDPMVMEYLKNKMKPVQRKSTLRAGVDAQGNPVYKRFYEDPEGGPGQVVDTGEAIPPAQTQDVTQKTIDRFTTTETLEEPYKVVPGLIKTDKGVKIKPDVADKLRQGVPMVENLVKNIDKMIAHLKKVPTVNLIGKDAGTAQSLATGIQLELKSPDFANLGVLAGPDLGLLQQQLPSSWLNIDKAKSVAAVEELRRQVVQKFGLRMKGYGFKPDPKLFAPLPTEDVGGGDDLKSRAQKILEKRRANKK